MFNVSIKSRSAATSQPSHPPTAAPTLAALLLSAACFALTACGGATSDPPALRVGSTTISNATISHWMDVANATDQKSVVDGVDLVRVALKPPQFSACVKRLKAK